MAKPIVSDVYDAARTLAGDPSGQVLTYVKLEPFYKLAYSELFRALQNSQNVRINQKAYYDLAAFTSFLDPATAGIANLGEVTDLRERGGVTEATITGATPGVSSLSVTAVGHPFSTGDQIVQFGMLGLSDDANGMFTITKTGANTYTANGCTATGTWTSGGIAAKSLEQFVKVDGPKTAIDPSLSPQTTLREFTFDGDIFRFPVCSVARQLRISYTLSGAAPTSTTATIQIDDSKDFLSLRICGLALASRGNAQKAAAFTQAAVGAQWEQGIAGGVLNQLISAGIRNDQQRSIRRPRFRPRRAFENWY